MSKTLLNIDAISHSFDSLLFSDVAMSLSESQSAAIIGRSGSGKSTLLHIISTFIRPHTGNVTLLDKDIYDLKDSKIESIRRYDIGMIFQFHYLFKGMSGIENIEVATMLSGEEIDNELLDKLEISDLVHKKVGELSGGQQQRVSIARVLSKKPKIIFADEPTGNLDSKTATLVMDVIFEYIKTNNAVLVLVTHDSNMANRCEKIFEIEDKKLKKIK